MAKKSKGFKNMEMSKKLLVLDYVVAGILLLVFFIFAIINGIYSMSFANKLLSNGISMSTYIVPFDLSIFGILLSTWIIQLGLSTGAYYLMCKSDHKMQLPMKLVNDLPKDIKEKVDMTEIITTVLNSTNN